MPCGFAIQAEEVETPKENDGDQFVLPGEAGHEGDDAWEGVDEEGTSGGGRSVEILGVTNMSEEEIARRRGELQREHEERVAAEEDEDDDDRSLNSMADEADNFLKGYGVRGGN